MFWRRKREIDEEGYDATRKAVREAFKLLRKEGFTARMAFKCCQTCALDALPDDVGKYVYFHRQDDDCFKQGGKLHLRYGDSDEGEDTTEAAGERIVAVLREQGCLVEWDGDGGTAIAVVGHFSSVARGLEAIGQAVSA